jgi:Protein of unknown function (DUF2442)
MRTISKINALENFNLFVEFTSGEKKTFDMNTYLKLPAFEPINKPAFFKKVVNKKYYVVWEPFDIDLSADTLWHEGKA